MPTINFYQTEDFTALGPHPALQNALVEAKQMGKGRGFTTGNARLLTPIFAKRKTDGEITLRGPPINNHKY